MMRRQMIMLAGLGVAILCGSAHADSYDKTRFYGPTHSFTGQAITRTAPGGTKTTDYQDKQFNTTGHAKTDASGRTTYFDKNWNPTGSSR